MDSSIQPLLLMLLSTIKNEKNEYTQYLPLLIIILPYIFRIIPLKKISEIILKMIDKNNDYISINIYSHEVPVLKSYSSVSVLKTVYSKNFLSIIYYLNNNKRCKIESLTEIMTNNSSLSNHYDNDDIKKDQFILIPLNNEKILISEEYKIYCDFNTIENKNNDTDDENNKKIKSNKKHNYIITLSIKKSDMGNIEIIKKFLDNCIEEYNLSISKKKNDDILYIYEYKNSEKSETESKIELHFDEFLMEHNKDLLKNIFFEDKDKLINYIKPFIYDPNETINLGEEKYKRSGFTFKAGLLFYGSPGCGKTSTIKAILKYTNRNAIIINLSKIKTCEELQNIFRKRMFNGKELSGKRICYVLEDCDAFDDNIIQSRNDEELKKNNEKDQTLDKLLEMSMTTVNINQKDNDKVNLSCFLNILDGIIELHGIMIIMTTNYPEKIDEALIRPGRFDFKYEFKKASKGVIKEMLKFKYDLKDEDLYKYTKNMNIKDEILSPAEIQSICFKNDDITGCMNDIILASQK